MYFKGFRRIFTNFRLDSRFSTQCDFIRFKIRFDNRSFSVSISQLKKNLPYSRTVIRCPVRFRLGFRVFVPISSAIYGRNVKKAEIQRRFRLPFLSLCFIELSESINYGFRMSIEIKINFKNIRFISFR